jgi:hypothetical protein
MCVCVCVCGVAACCATSSGYFCQDVPSLHLLSGEGMLRCCITLLPYPILATDPDARAGEDQRATSLFSLRPARADSTGEREREALIIAADCAGTEPEVGGGCCVVLCWM